MSLCQYPFTQLSENQVKSPHSLTLIMHSSTFILCFVNKQQLWIQLMSDNVCIINFQYFWEILPVFGIISNFVTFSSFDSSFFILIFVYFNLLLLPFITLFTLVLSCAEILPQTKLVSIKGYAWTVENMEFELSTKVVSSKLLSRVLGSCSTLKNVETCYLTKRFTELN